MEGGETSPASASVSVPLPDVPSSPGVVTTLRGVGRRSRLNLPCTSSRLARMVTAKIELKAPIETTIVSPAAEGADSSVRSGEPREGAPSRRGGATLGLR